MRRLFNKRGRHPGTYLGSPRNPGRLRWAVELSKPSIDGCSYLWQSPPWLCLVWRHTIAYTSGVSMIVELVEFQHPQGTTREHALEVALQVVAKWQANPQ